MEKQDFAIEEYRLAHEELLELWELFWKQATYFLTLSAALIAFVSADIQFLPVRPLLLVVAVFGLVIATLWLFHGNRFFLYIQTTEQKMIDLEKEDPRLTMKLKSYQWARYSQKKELRFFERRSGSIIRNILLPFLVILIWAVIIFALLYGMNWAAQV